MAVPPFPTEKSTGRYLDLANPGLAELTPYQPGKPIGEVQRELGISRVIKLASNENPLGPSPKALAAVRAATNSDLALYPEGAAPTLRAALSDFHDVNPERITITDGSDQAVQLLASAYLRSGLNAVISRHTFSAYSIMIVAAGGEVRAAPALSPSHNTQPYGHDVDAMLSLVDKNTRLLFIANPANPTGTCIDERSLLRLLRAVPSHVLVVLDEAYYEFVEWRDYPDGIRISRDFENLIVTRTFSKAYGLAGFRVGYALSNSVVADVLNRIRLPFNVGTLAQIAATAALKDSEHVRRTVELNRVGRQQLQAGLARLDLSFIPSVTNFVTVDTGRDANVVFESLLRKGVIVRPLIPYELPRHIRISVGAPDQNQIALAALEAALNE